MIRSPATFLIALGVLAAGPLGSAAARAQAKADLARATFLAEMDGEFRKRDADRNGSITRAELEVWERGQAIASVQARNRAEFQRLDSDRNGVLSPGEFAALAAVPSFVDVGTQMQRFDPNRDQVITLIEFRGATLANFDRLDTDHDGVVTAAESMAGGVPAKR